MLLLPLLLSTISCGHHCPACPTLPRPAPEVVIQPRPPCHLPPLPQPATLGGVPNADGTVTVTKDGLGELARYLLGVRQWIAAAQICLDATDLFPPPPKGKIVTLCGRHCPEPRRVVASMIPEDEECGP